MNLGNNDKFCFIDLFYSPVKSLIKEELPLSENYPLTYNPNRSKFYYSNVTLSKEGNFSFDIIIQNLEAQIKKFNTSTTSENKTVVIFDNLSLLPNSGRILLDDVNNLIKFSSDNVCLNFIFYFLVLTPSPINFFLKTPLNF